ncbi:MAG TPA: hypothetical protein EYQ09_00925 [Flavobacteriales bacterium]|nr:hypothetical protein [Flavobacteriales bacterium]
MGRRLLFFGFGALISISFLSLGPENRLKSTFYEYVNYYNPEKRVVSQLLQKEHDIIYTNNDSSEIANFLEGSWVNHELTNKESYPQIFVLDNLVKEIPSRLKVRFYNKEERKSEGERKRYSKAVFQEIETGITLSKRSYKSYYSLIGIFFLIMIPVSLLVRKLIKKSSS